MHWSVPVTAIIGFDRVYFFFCTFFFSIYFLFSGMKRNVTTTITMLCLFICTPCKIVYFLFILLHAINIPFPELYRVQCEAKWTRVCRFIFHHISTWLSRSRRVNVCECLWWVWTVSVNRSSFSFSIKCTSVTFNLICCFAGCKRFVLSRPS